MKFFTRNELVGVGIILLLLFGISFNNFKVAERRARDTQRKSDIDAVVNGLESFRNDFGLYPPSEDGKILACKPIKTVDLSSRPKSARPPEGYEKLTLYASPCTWGKDPLADISDDTFPAYIDSLPLDPHSGQGASYFYLSDGAIFQIFTSLESPDEPGGQTPAHRE